MTFATMVMTMVAPTVSYHEDEKSPTQPLPGTIVVMFVEGSVALTTVSSFSHKSLSLSSMPNSALAKGANHKYPCVHARQHHCQN